MDMEKFLLESGAVKFGDFTLASGRKSSYYVDIKKAATHPGFLKESARRMALAMPDCQRVAGVELGAVPLAVALSMETSIPYIIVRKKPKGYGTSSLIEGPLEAGERVLFVEDVTTTGGSLIKGVAAVRK
ncbi:MAG TPA: orotate phosphoribosyltransferase, partial [Euryarchaeota archaeon]|nr:orotate phosphoribosyltransferase [Euryarchaeota archaeon]